MRFFVKSVATGFAMALGSALFRKVSDKMGLDEDAQKSKKKKKEKETSKTNTNKKEKAQTPATVEGEDQNDSREEAKAGEESE